MEAIFQMPGWFSADWIRLGATLVPLLIRAAIIAAITLFVARLARNWFERAALRTRADAGLRLLIGRVIYVAIVVLGSITILDTFGVPLGTMLTMLGVFGIGISLALQDILKNFFAGTYLLFERPFRIGDEVQVKGQRGNVETVGVRTITLRTAENVEIMVPNAMVFTEIVINRTQERGNEAAKVAQAEIWWRRLARRRHR